MNLLARTAHWVVHGLLIGVLAGAALLLIGPQISDLRLPVADRYQLLTVLSGSMSPVFAAGDLILIERVAAADLAVGDIITFRQDERLITHRIIAAERTGGRLLFITQGDANAAPDERLVVPEFIAGRYLLRIAYGGRLSQFVQTPLGVALFIGLPGLYLIGCEVRKMFAALAAGEQPK